MIHHMTLQPKPFEQIATGAKTIELRLYDSKRQQIHAGDTIQFTNLSNGKIISAYVIKLHIFDSFAELYRNLPLISCGYTADTVGTAAPEDMLEYYSESQLQQYKVVGIELVVEK